MASTFVKEPCCSVHYLGTEGEHMEVVEAERWFACT